MESKDEMIKLEIVRELGLLEKVKTYGWKSLSSKETGRIGGLITRRKKQLLEAESSQQA